MWRKLLSTNDDGLLTFLRLALVVTFLPHGLQKLFGWFGGGGLDGTLAMFSSMGIPVALSWLAIAAEVIGPLALFAGFLTRVGAFGLACNMVVAVFTVHWKNGFFMNWMGTKAGEGIEYHLLALTILLAVMVRGAGAFSVDRELWLRTFRQQRREFGLRQSA